MISKKPGDTNPVVLYIMGTARSGTTILEVLLAASSRVQGMGEVVHIFRDGYSGVNRCSCGMPAHSCPLWSAVWTTCGWRQDQLPELARLHRQFSWHTRFPLVAFGLSSSRSKASFERLTTGLFRAVARKTGATTIVDSSKYAARAIALARYYRGEVKIICLTRSPKGLANAFATRGTGDQKPKSALATLLYYSYTLACFRFVNLLFGSKIFMLRYEDLRSDPVACVRQIARWSGISLDKTIATLASDGCFPSGHIVTGNRLRRKERIRFRTSEDTERTGMSRITVRLMRFWRLLLRF